MSFLPKHESINIHLIFGYSMSFIDEAKRKTKCRGKTGCQVVKGEQRLAVQVDNPFTKSDPDDTMNHYYCLACAAKKFQIMPDVRLHLQHCTTWGTRGGKRQRALLFL